MKTVEIENIKNIRTLRFVIPDSGLHIITGTNGAGKTTLFTCINRICNNNAYRIGFPAKSIFDFDMFLGKITYKVDDQEVSYSRRDNGEWRPNTRNSTVLHSFNFPAILNITTKDTRIFSQEIIVPRRKSVDTWINEKLNKILDTNKFSQMMKITTGDLRRGRGEEKDRRHNIAYIIPLGNNKYYTERNFSFGEIVLLNMLFDIQSMPNGSMILIDELELAIHPSSQVRLINFLKELAKERNLTILVSTHSASIIKAQKDVIFLNANQSGDVEVIYNCPPAKAIGAIGMREDADPDIIILVEDTMAKSLFFALKQKYMELQHEENYLDIRILDIGSYKNVVHFYNEARNYIFYDNVYVSVFLDKDVETDVVPYPQYGDTETIRTITSNSERFHFLPYSPEVLLVKMLYQHKSDLLRYLKSVYQNQLLTYSTQQQFDYDEYDQPFPAFSDMKGYNAYMENRGNFRSRCKKEANRIASEICGQLNISKDEFFRLVFKFAVDNEPSINIQELLAITMKRKHN